MYTATSAVLITESNYQCLFSSECESAERLTGHSQFPPYTTPRPAREREKVFV